jgi:subtilase family serine protease
MNWPTTWFNRKSSTFATFFSSRRVPRVTRKKPITGFQPHVEQLEEKLLLTVFTPTYVVHPHSHGNVGPAASAAPPASALTPAQLRTAYGINGITFQSNGGTITGDGSGETIAIVDAYDDPSIAADLAAFDQQFGIAAPPSFTKVGISSRGVASTTSFPRANQGWAGEVELDVEWAHAVAPGANILLVEASSSSDSALMTAVDYARNYSSVVAVSMSWGGDGESSGETVDDSHFTTPAGHTGVTFFASSGDDSTIGYPAISSHVVAVGGTALNVTSSGTYISESAWSDGGGGISPFVSQPSYQNNLVVHNGTQIVSTNGMRAGPDVSSDADPNTGVAVYGTYGFGGWAEIGGTSAGAPAWAGLMALVDQGRAAAGLSSLDGYTQTLPALYALPSTDFHDVTTGANANGDTAGPGFDIATGRGTPVANLLVPALAGNSGGSSGSSNSTPPTVTQPQARLAAAATAVNLTALGADVAGESTLTYTWSATGTPPGSVAFSANGTNAAKATVATLGAAGAYTFQVTVTDASGLSATSQVSITVSQVQTSISVSPAAATVAANGTTQFSAAALDQFGAAMATQPSFTWSVTSGGGSVSNTGLYTAPASAGSATVQASVGNLTNSASVTVITQNATTSTLTAGPVSYFRRYALATLTLVIAPASGSVLPTGTVEFFYGGSVLGTATIQIINGMAVAQLQVRFSANGAYSFSAEYMGTSSFQGSTSNSVTVDV